MDRKQIIRRYCELSALVSAVIDPENKQANDCFCDLALDKLSYANDRGALHFIQDAVFFALHEYAKPKNIDINKIIHDWRIKNLIVEEEHNRKAR